MIRKCVIVLPLVLLACLAATAQNATAPNQTSQGAADSLTINRGDTIHVQVFDTAEFDQSGRVDDSGLFTLALGGDIKLLGMSLSEAGRAIASFYVNNNFLKHPKVLVTMQSSAVQEVTVTGEVRSQGKIAIPTPLSILDVLSRAGGLTTLADRHVLVQRFSTQEKIPFFLPNDPSEALSDAITIYPGDTIVVPKAGIVYALGDVKTPGGFTMTNNEGKITVLQLVARAGGVDLTGKPSSARLIRRTKDGYIEMPLPLAKMQKGELADFALAPDDVVYVPFSYLKLFASQASGMVTGIGTATIYRF